MSNAGGRWTYCPHCGSIGFVDWGYGIHIEAGTCPNTSWRGVGEEIIDRSLEECDRLNELEEQANQQPNYDPTHRPYDDPMRHVDQLKE